VKSLQTRGFSDSHRHRRDAKARKFRPIRAGSGDDSYLVSQCVWFLTNNTMAAAIRVPTTTASSASDPPSDTATPTVPLHSHVTFGPAGAGSVMLGAQGGA
jgi:hypothetical protein